MPAGNLFAFTFFALLSLAALTSSISLLKPVLAFLEEAFLWRRSRATAALGALMALGAGWTWYFSKDLKALDTMDFWVGNVGVFALGTIVIVLFGWGIGPEKGWRELRRGAELRVPRIFYFVMRYVTPFYLLTIFSLFVLAKIVGWNFSFSAPQCAPSDYVTDLTGGGKAGANTAAQLTIVFLATLLAGILALIFAARRRWRPRRNWADATHEKTDANAAALPLT
jgi:hypothetical protein